MIAERRSEKERRHRSQLITMLYGCSLLIEMSEARRLYATVAPLPSGRTEYKRCEGPLFYFENALFIGSSFLSLVTPVTSGQLGASRRVYWG